MRQILINGAVLGLFFALLACSFSLLFKLTNYLHLALAELYIISAYLTLFGSRIGLNPVQSLIIIIPVTLVLGFIFAKLAPPGTNDLSVLLVSLGIAIILQNLIQFIWGADMVSIPLGVFANSYGGISLGRYTVVIISSGSLGVLFYLLRCTKLGLSIRAASENIEAAKVIGINLKRLYTMIFLLAALLAGLSGLCSAFLWAFSPFKGLEYLIIAILVTVIGGPGSIRGALVAGLFFGYMSIFSSIIIGAIWESLILFASLGVIMLLKPKGLFGRI